MASKNIENLSNDPVVLPHSARSRHSDEEWRRIERFLQVRETRSGWELKARSRYAGSIIVGDRFFYVPPPVPISTFLGMVLIAEGLDEIVDQQFLATTERYGTDAQTIFQVLSALLVVESERIVSGHVAQGYVSERARITTIRGRPVFAPQKPRPPDGRILCDYWTKSTDVPLNQIMLAGLAAATTWLPATWSKRCRTQRFVWSTLTEHKSATLSTLSMAHRSINRLTHHYRAALAISEVLLFGWDPEATPARGEHTVSAPMFDLANLFEALVERVASIQAKRFGLQALPQVTHRNAIKDATGATYRRIRPDVLIVSPSGPVAVLDAKFKPRYVSNGPKLTRESRITREDLFQMFFYRERLLRSLGIAHTLPAIIVAPQLPGAVPPAREYRTITWMADTGDSEEIPVIVVPLDLVGATSAVLARNADLVSASIPELESLVVGLAARRGDLNSVERLTNLELDLLQSRPQS